jgi:signal peptidase I
MSFPPTNQPDEEPTERREAASPEFSTQPLPVGATAGGDGSVDWADYEAPPKRSGWLKTRRYAVEIVQTLILAIVIFFAVRGVAQNFRVEGSSMEPSLHDGQFLLVNKAVYFKINLDTLGKYIPFIDGGDEPERFLFASPKRGDVVVFRFPGDTSRDFIKRIIGVPGDTVEVVNGVVYVNGVELEEDYITNAGSYNVAPTEVPPEHYFVLGDNRSNSFDSHVWGLLPFENIIGKAMISYWPLSEFGGVGNRTINLGVISLPIPVP